MLAIRGMGGFHLAVNGCSSQAVALLRARKGRPDKPLAIMVAIVEVVKKFCHLTPDAEELLTSPQHPIVLLPRKKDTALADNLAPGN